MDNQSRSRWADLRYLTLFPKRYGSPQGLSADEWKVIIKEFSNLHKRMRSTGYRWYVITFKDGRKELSYLKVRTGGIYSSDYFRGGVLCRGIIPRRWHVTQYAHVESIRVAF